MAGKAFPKPDGMIPFWRTSLGQLDNHRSTEELPAECDIVVIGGGYSAASFVEHALSRNNSKPPSILILEARQLCSGATGRNGGHLKPDAYHHISQLADEYGIHAAAEVADFEAANVVAVKEYIEQEKVDCDLIVTRAVDVQFSKSQDDKIKAGYDKLKAAGVKATQEAFYFGGSHAEKVSGVKGAKGCFSYTACHLWPYKLIHHMFSKAVEKGVNLQTNTPVTDISSARDSNGLWTITTARGTVKAKKVVMATNAYTSALLPEYKDKIIPYRAICSHIVTPKPAPLLVNTYALRFKDWDFDYLIPRPDGSIIVGGARSAFFKDFNEWYGNVDDSHLIESAKHYFDGYMQRHFLGWENSGAYVADLWTGIMGYSSDRLPRVGPVPGRPGIFVMAGFTGHGMPQIFLCAKAMVKMVVDDLSFVESGLPKLFEETKPRLENPQNKVLDTYLRAKGMSIPRL